MNSQLVTKLNISRLERLKILGGGGTQHLLKIIADSQPLAVELLTLELEVGIHGTENDAGVECTLLSRLLSQFSSLEDFKLRLKFFGSRGTNNDIEGLGQHLNLRRFGGGGYCCNDLGLSQPLNRSFLPQDSRMECIVVDDFTDKTVSIVFKESSGMSTNPQKA